jgi:hypothetical protein
MRHPARASGCLPQDVLPQDVFMSERSLPRDLAKYLAVARQHLSEDKVRDFETAYLRLRERAARWDQPKPSPVEKPQQQSDSE